MYIINHGTNYIAAYPTQSEAAIASSSKEPILVEGALIPATVLKLEKGDYYLADGTLHSPKFGIQVPVFAHRQWKDRTPVKCRQQNCSKLTRSVTRYCRKHLPNSKYR